MTGAFPLTPLEPWIAQKIGHEGLPLRREALHRYQLEKLNETLSLARNKSRFYRRTLWESPQPLRALEELACLPFSGPEDLRACPLDFVCVPQDEVQRIVTLPTSGTTGPPKRVYFSAADQELTRDFFHHGMSTLVGPGDRVLILLPASLPGSVGDLLREGLGRMDVEGIPHGPVLDVRETLAVLESERATALVGVPVQVFALARLALAERRSGAGALHSVLLSTDRVPGPVAQVIERAWGCLVYNHFGMTETGLGGGVDCRARAGFHLREADLLFEIVDPASGRVVRDGEAGELVFTTLTRQAMPLIRYRTGDLGRFIPAQCACGTVLKRMAHIDDRLAGGLPLPGGGLLRQRDFDEALFALDGLLDFRVLASDDDPCTGAGAPRSEAGRRMGLTIEVKSEDGTPAPADDVVRALAAVPPLATALASGRLSLDVKEWDPAGETVMGKRQIVYRGGMT